MVLEIPDEIKQAIADVRDDKSDTNFVVASYDESVDNALCLLGSGPGGVEALKGAVKESEVCYCLLREDYNYESVGAIKSNGTAFIFVYYRPETIPIKRKMMIGSNEGQVKKVFSSYMKSLEIASLNEISQEKVDDIIGTVTQLKSKVTTKQAKSGFLIGGQHVDARTADGDKGAAYSKPDSRANFGFNKSKGAAVSFTDEEKVKEEVGNVRSDTDPCRWCLFTYINKKEIEFSASGNGDVSELLAACEDDKISYGLFRFEEVYDGQPHVKFGFVHWVPENGLSPVLKATISTHKGTVTPFFRPFHHQFYVENRSELTEEKAIDAISSLTGTKSKVTDRKADKKESVYVRKMIGGTTKETQLLQYVDEEELRVAIAGVRNNDVEDDWVLGGFIGDKKNVQFGLKGKGTGGAEGFVAALDESHIQYGLIRTIEKVDGYDTVKFTMIQYQPESIPLTLKGAVGVYHGAVTAMFSPHHANETTSDKNSILNKLS
mmetsp:Transcript_9265/g.11108  ORF Transcript_9265/g.11108 Transcript_9265/m.11108 type:complete len:491 (+) Transcript_9265:132-1604(+)